MKSLKSRIMLIMCIGFLSFVISGCGLNQDSKNETKSFEGNEVEEIYIKTGAQNIELRPSNDAYIKVSMKTALELPAKLSGNVLTVDVEESDNMINIKTETLYVDLPGEVYKKISLITTSGNITGEKLNTDELVLTSDSGEIDINGFDGKMLKGEIVAGNVTLKGINGDLDINNDTGNVTVSHKGIFQNDSSIRSNTGKVEVEFENKPDSCN